MIKGIFLLLGVCLFVRSTGALPQSAACPCHRIHFPVCGSDGRTYVNICELKCEQKIYPYLTMVGEEGDSCQDQLSHEGY